MGRRLPAHRVDQNTDRDQELALAGGCKGARAGAFPITHAFASAVTVPIPHGATHAPSTHDTPIGQLAPQAPQFAGSRAMSMHAGPQQTSPAAHPQPRQDPSMQSEPGGQMLPHAPQLSGSKRVSVQPSGQSVCPSGQVHSPATQA